MKWPVLLALILSLAQPALAESGFLSGSGDLPLMPGLLEDQKAAVIFDTPEGRIAHFAAQGAALPAEVKRFYEEALPELGWTSTGPNRFKREGEILQLTIKKDGKKGLEVRFDLTPSRP
ncbi:MAG: hypothetical protein HQL45_04000 [Alphaproteobacteria bacterium]|nr:hypothetical protein [Alphaproteobacteria bacterium]